MPTLNVANTFLAEDTIDYLEWSQGKSRNFVIDAARDGRSST